MNNIVWLEFDLILNNCSGLDRSHRLWHNNNKKVAVRWPEENQTGIKGSSCLPVMSSQDISLEAESETWSTCQIKGIRKSDEKNQNYKRKRREGRKAIRGGEGKRRHIDWLESPVIQWIALCCLRLAEEEGNRKSRQLTDWYVSELVNYRVKRFLRESLVTGGLICTRPWGGAWSIKKGTLTDTSPSMTLLK